MKEKLRALQEAEIQDETELMDKIQACTSDITQITQMATLQLNVSLIDLKGLIINDVTCIGRLSRAKQACRCWQLRRLS